jgi:hypothetical protein
LHSQSEVFRLKVFQILNGGSTGSVLRKTPIAGDYLAWREDLMTSCVLQKASSGQHGWLDLRSAQLAAAFGIEETSCRAELERQQNSLCDSLSAEEVMLWFPSVDRSREG